MTDSAPDTHRLQDHADPPALAARRRWFGGRLPKRKSGDELRAEMAAWEASGEGCKALGHVWTKDNGRRCGACGVAR